MRKTVIHVFVWQDLQGHLKTKVWKGHSRKTRAEKREKKKSVHPSSSWRNLGCEGPQGQKSQTMKNSAEDLSQNELSIRTVEVNKINRNKSPRLDNIHPGVQKPPSAWTESLTSAVTESRRAMCHFPDSALIQNNWKVQMSSIKSIPVELCGNTDQHIWHLLWAN